MWGTQRYGTVERCGRTFVATSFFHVMFLPLFPVQSVLVLERRPGWPERGVALERTHRGSVLAGYLRTWPLALGPLLALWIGDAALSAESPATGLFGLGVAAMLIAMAGAVAVIAFAAMGRLSPAERAQRASYEKWIGYPADVALLGGAREGYRATVRAEVTRRALGLAPSGYRDAPNPETDWPEIALHPTVSDLAFLDATLTLARLEWSLAEGAAREKHAKAHAAIWSKLQATLRTRRRE